MCSLPASWSGIAVACVQTLLTKLKRVEKVESAQLSFFSCSKVPQNQGTEFDWFGEFQLFFLVFKEV